MHECISVAAVSSTIHQTPPVNGIEELVKWQDLPHPKTCLGREEKMRGEKHTRTIGIGHVGFEF